MLQIGVLQDCSNASKIWEPLRPKQPKIPWSKVIRKGPTVPMHSFIARFTLQNHFPTEGWFIGLGSAIFREATGLKTCSGCLDRLQAGAIALLVEDSPKISECVNNTGSITVTTICQPFSTASRLFSVEALASTNYVLYMSTSLRAWLVITVPIWSLATIPRAAATAQVFVTYAPTMLTFMALVIGRAEQHSLAS
ncbi:hypothetical protein V6N13_038330 [Hibiscus sabdariffa]